MIAYFAVLGVALCVAMMLIVVSVMDGFLLKIEAAAKGLFGDIVIRSGGGLGHYTELIGDLKKEVPEIEAASPFILTGGILRIPGQPHYQQLVQIAGIELPSRARATDFGKGLFTQQAVASPSFDPPIDLVLKRLAEHTAEAEHLLREATGLPGSAVSAQDQRLRRRLEGAIAMQRQAADILQYAGPYQQPLRQAQRQLDQARLRAGGLAGTSEEVDDLSGDLLDLEEKARYRSPRNRIILGLGLPQLSFRTEHGETVRVFGPGQRVALTLIPLGRAYSPTGTLVNTTVFTVIDDCRTGVNSIDSGMVYVPLETLQRLNDMATEYSAEDPSKIVRSARCGQIHVKVKPGFSNGRKLLDVRSNVEHSLADFLQRRPDAADMAPTVQTWRQDQADLVGPIEKQRTLTVIMFGIISLVSVVLIFVIFYMIVFQKTRDIGVLKAVGASSSGVAGIFLTYGAAVGLVGSILGTVAGYYFVRHINEIQDAVDRWFGFRVWSAEVFLFDKIPNEVDWGNAVGIVIGSVLAGIVGALIPAIRAAGMQPVEALRYE